LSSGLNCASEFILPSQGIKQTMMVVCINSVVEFLINDSTALNNMNFISVNT